MWEDFSTDDVTAPQWGRREFLKMSALLGAAGLFAGHSLSARAAAMIDLPFVNGERKIIPAGTFPQKGEMILQRVRPPLLETPWSVFDRHIFTPNDQFYVRWHMPDFPDHVDVKTYRIRVTGLVKKPLEISLEELLHDFPLREMAAVNQCSGNSRGFVNPRVNGAQWANGAMGNAVWAGVALRELLQRAGVKKGATHLAFRSLEKGMAPFPADTRFEKVLDLEHGNDGEVMLAYAMNGATMPLLNGFPVRLVVPGWYSTYWVKMLTEIEVMDHPGTGFWMTKAYLIPDTPTGYMTPGEKGVKMVPINRMKPRSFFTEPGSGARVAKGHPVQVGGIAMGGSTALERVLFSADGGAHWQKASLGHDYGPYSFRAWQASFTPEKAGTYTLMVKAVNRQGEEQPLQGGWNPGGFMYNAIEHLPLQAV
jgi:DMSO/TMAO reductase YedYZ molybdopterin-dependent catalytic subunit